MITNEITILKKYFPDHVWTCIEAKTSISAKCDKCGFSLRYYNKNYNWVIDPYYYSNNYKWLKDRNYLKDNNISCAEIIMDIALL